jgi:hypothetical protein
LIAERAARTVTPKKNAELKRPLTLCMNPIFFYYTVTDIIYVFLLETRTNLLTAKLETKSLSDFMLLSIYT